MNYRQAASVVWLIAAGSLLPAYTQGQEDSIEEIEVRGRKINLVGDASSASEGVVSQEELAIRPLLRTGEVLETVPGLVATQHSGPGKANQFYLRGFNLDHGTDFSTVVEGMPVNMRSHGHGQGYTDLNFIIPEMLGQIAYRKGSYYPDVGDFSGTGNARMSMRDRIDGHRLKLGSDLGSEDWRRVLAMGQADTGDDAALLYGAEFQVGDGQWDDIDSDVDRKNLWLRQRWESGADRYNLTFMGYDNSWNSADQIPQRAVDRGLITELGSIDTTTGGESSRHSVSGGWVRDTGSDQLQASAYAIDYEMDLYSNFTFFTEPGGDQFNQVDSRRIYGGEASWTREGDWGGRSMRNTLGTEMRYDDIEEVGLYRSRARERTGIYRLDAVEEWNLGLYWENEIRWTDHLRTVAGLRYDYYDFTVAPVAADHSPSVAVNGGDADANLLTPTLNVIYTLNDNLEVYTSVGEGFHSNDARGVTAGLDPVSGAPVESADPLVDTLGYEFGLRGYWNSLNASIAVWALDIDSELIFVGDTGSTEDTGVGSERYGVEVAAYYYPNDVVTLDLEYAWSNARLERKVDGSDAIPGALEHVLSAGINAQWTSRAYSNLRMRHFGDYPLDGGAEAEASTIVNFRSAYQLTEQVEVSLDILNLLNSDDRDIQYYYESQLPGEPEPVADHHFHIFEPRTYHLNLEYRF